jgi:hypothetical protein
MGIEIPANSHRTLMKTPGQKPGQKEKPGQREKTGSGKNRVREQLFLI